MSGCGAASAHIRAVLLVSTVGLDYYALTLLVINAYAAAMLGRLKSLPLTFLGAMSLGLVTSYASGYLPTEGLLNSVRNVVPALFLFAVIVAMPQAQLRIGQVKGIVSAPLPSPFKALGWSGALLLGVMLLASGMSEANLLLVGTAARVIVWLITHIKTSKNWRNLCLESPWLNKRLDLHFCRKLWLWLKPPSREENLFYIILERPLTMIQVLVGIWTTMFAIQNHKKKPGKISKSFLK